MGPLAQSSPLQTLGPQQGEVHGSFYRGAGRSYPGDLPGVKSPRIKEFLKGEGRAWRVLWETPCPHTTVGGAHSYNSLCSERLSLPLRTSPPRCCCPLFFLSSISHGHRAILYRKIHVGQVDGELAPPTHTFWFPTKHLPIHGRLNKAGHVDT